MRKKSEIVNIIILFSSIPLVLIWSFLSGGKGYYILSAAIIILSMTLFFISFERKNTKTRELTAIAALTALSVASRAAFYMLPEIKPIASIVIATGTGFGYETGFLVGALSMFLSNIIFGQGLWTPFQMLGLGMTGLICGMIFSNKKINRWILGLLGGLITFLVYGIIADTSSVFMLSADFNIKSVLTVYLSGAPLNLTFAVTTAVCLILFGKPLIETLLRLKTKYGIFCKE